MDAKKDITILTDFYTEGPVIDSNGNIYVTNLLGKEILKYDGDNEFSVWATCTSPNGQFISNNQEHFICNSLAGSIERFDQHGNHIETYFQGEIDGHPVACPNDLWIGDQGMYFTDSVRYAGAVLFIDNSREKSVIADQLDYPNGIVFDKKRNCLYVAESYKNRIIKINLNQPNHPVSTLVELPSHPTGEEARNLPDGLFLEQDAKLWIAHYGMRQYHCYDIEEERLDSFDIDITRCSNIYVNNELIVLTGGEGEPGPGRVRIIQRGKSVADETQKISKLTLGTVALGLPYVVFDDNPSVAKSSASDIIQKAYQAGITAFDTAREYGKAESLLGNLIEQDQLRDAVIISKFKWSNEACHDDEKALEEALASVRASLQQLKLSKLPICLFHMVSSFDVQSVKGILPKVFARLKELNLIEKAGVSVDHPLEIRHFIDDDIYSAFQIPINILDHRLTSTNLWKELVDRKKTIFVRSIYLKGLLLQDPDHLTGNLVEARPFLKSLNALAIEAHMSVSQLCFSYIRDLEGVTSVIIGPDKEEQLMENISLENGPEIPKDTLNKIATLFAEVPEHLLTPRLWKM